MSHPPARRSRARLAALALVVLLAAIAVRPVSATLRAASLLTRFADDKATGALADLGRRAVREEPAAVETSRGPVRARLYLPDGTAYGDKGASPPTLPLVATPDMPGSLPYPGVVLVHGVHRLGIDEPRLVRFARAVASSGVVVLTPEVQEIADYRVDPASVETIGAAARTLRARLGAGKAGVMGMSFAGGLSLLAAADPRFVDDIGFVVAVGAHDDLARVSRFFATDAIETPDGSQVHLHAHDYGALVMIYGNAERFFPAEDVPAARDALRLWLWDQHDDARARAEALGPEAWAKVDALFDGRIDLVAPEILAETERDHDAMERVSPHGKLGAVRAPVFLLHGAGDTVIPAVETAWLASEVPAGLLRETLVSPAIVHVEMDQGTHLSDQWALVRFMARVLEEADAARG